QRCGYRRILYSFPTRRSSDLGIIILVILFFVLRACGIDPLAMLAEDGGLTTSPGGQMTSGEVRSNDEMTQFVATVLAETEDTWRSEEHTSELQSRENLVCRLL